MVAGVALQMPGRWARVAGRLAELSHGRKAAAAYVVVIACLAGWIVWESLRPLQQAVTEAIALQPARPLSLPAASPIPTEALAALQQRVLFKVRNQGAADTAVQATARELLKKLQLRSVTQQGQGWIAYIQVKGEGIKRVAAGDKVAEFAVVQVERSAVHLKLGSEQVTLGF
jgi:hypothetical protein